MACVSRSSPSTFTASATIGGTSHVSCRGHFRSLDQVAPEQPSGRSGDFDRLQWVFARHGVEFRGPHAGERGRDEHAGSSEIPHQGLSRLLVDVLEPGVFAAKLVGHTDGFPRDAVPGPIVGLEEGLSVLNQEHRAGQTRGTRRIALRARTPRSALRTASWRLAVSLVNRVAPVRSTTATW